MGIPIDQPAIMQEIDLEPEPVSAVPLEFDTDVQHIRILDLDASEMVFIFILENRIAVVGKLKGDTKTKEEVKNMVDKIVYKIVCLARNLQAICKMLIITPEKEDVPTVSRESMSKAAEDRLKYFGICCCCMPYEMLRGRSPLQTVIVSKKPGSHGRIHLEDA